MLDIGPSVNTVWHFVVVLSLTVEVRTLLASPTFSQKFSPTVRN